MATGEDLSSKNQREIALAQIADERERVAAGLVDRVALPDASERGFESKSQAAYRSPPDRVRLIDRSDLT
jgi:hypothetical protein